MKKCKTLYLMTAAALLMAGCSAEKDAEQTSDGRVPINLSYSVQQAQLTRTNNATINDLYIAPGGQVHVNIIKNGTSDIIYDNNYYVTEASTATINTVENTPVSKMAPMSGVPCYPADGTGVDIKAYYPAIASTGSFSVRTDQSTDEGYAGSDLMWATPLTDQKVSDNPVNLNFTHQMAKIVLKINKGTGVSTINSVKLTNVNPNVTFTTSDGTTTLSGTATTNILVSSGDLTASDEIAAIIPAQTIAGEFIVVSTNSGNATFSIASKAFDANTKYSATLNLASSNIGATNTITAWTEAEFSAPGTFPAQSLGELTNIINSGGAYSDYLGWYVKADGSISSSDASAIGRIAYMNTDDVDEDIPGSRILVLGVTNVGDNVKWKNESTAGESTWNSLTKLNGYNFTINHLNSTNYPAAYQSYNWSTSRPSGSSKWFLPSYKQFDNMLTVVKMAGTGQITKSESDVTSRYWSATEFETNTAAYSYNFWMDKWGTNGKENTYHVRACFAYPSTYASLTSMHVGWLLTDKGQVYRHTAEIPTGQTAVAMIAYVGDPGTADSSTGAEHYRGLAIALTDASDGAAWYGTSEAYDAECLSSTRSASFSDYWNNSTSTYGKLEGIANTEILTGKKVGNTATSSGTGCGHTHAAANAALNYTVSVPAGTSGWFMPSGGQWMKFFGSAGLTMSTWTAWARCPDGAIGFTKINNMFINAGVNGFVFNNDDYIYYWASSETYSYNGMYVDLNKSRGVGLGGHAKWISHKVRPFLAF
ncbi:MAG: fimbrillin family protein [Prevotella sp.]|nr:fimbrillin family protein [Prevotella sp.]